MVLQSLIAEITGQVPPQAEKLVEQITTGRLLVVIFEDTAGALRVWQNELLKINGDAIREMNMWVACVPADGQPALLNGRPTDLPVAELRQAFSEGMSGAFQVVLLNFDGEVILRANGPVTIEQLADAVGRTGSASDTHPR
ncbi:Hypothetical protein NGAL_HAMBI1145_59220 [Neorhizobium galegae bv. officinalis]|uniref:DUF4174 domain-containing protein n=1 Tax=Neorhizobium galegae bv. officinalis TaxID=323656 RepID=A0A0T7G2N5_NEOGA|nr:DUF4174 domain-containing protein [Neorhizobium galegae]CDZ41490.1 Hypothetical protein NGAL_HAMBI1145_59220 [Neorhizobium galegae bv. officinalis]